MTITYHDELIQGSDEWLSTRCGLLSASEMKHIITPANLKAANNDKERAHVYELAVQRINNYVEPSYIGDDMLRGIADEVDARIKYEENYAPVKDVGFVTNDKFGFVIGCSPDGLVADDGGIESKSRKQRLQLQAILERAVPAEHIVQVQTCLLVTERKWWDYISYCGGMPMMVLRVYPDTAIQNAIVDAAEVFEKKVKKMIAAYYETLTLSNMRFVATERRRPDDDIITTEEGDINE